MNRFYPSFFIHGEHQRKLPNEIVVAPSFIHSFVLVVFVSGFTGTDTMVYLQSVFWDLILQVF
jgi:hypothetical protein